MENVSLKKSFHTQKHPLKMSNLDNTFQSEIPYEDKSEKFSIKKQLYRGIKDNDVSKIVGKSEGNSQQTTQQLYSEETQLHNYFTQMRKKYDDVKAISNNKKKDIQIRKKQLEQLKTKQQFLDQVIKGTKNQLAQTKDMLRKINSDAQTSSYTKDVYINIFERTRQDNLVIKKRLLDMEIQVSRTRNRLKTLLNDATSKKKIHQQCQKMLDSMQRVVQFEKNNRDSKIHSIYQILNKKQETYQKKANRQKQIEEVVISAMNQKSVQQKQWNKILLTNKFLSVILRKKIERQLSKNSKIQNAFQNIKINTGIVQCDDFVDKFLNREQNYGELLNSISQKQPKLENEQTQNQRLRKLEKQLLEKQSEQQIYETNNENQDYLKKLESIQKKRLAFQRQQQSLYQYLIKFLKKYDAITQNTRIKKQQKQNYYKNYPRSDLKSIYKKVLQIISKIVDQNSQKQQVIMDVLSKNKIQDFKQNDRMFERNTRVKTLVESTQQPEDSGEIYDQETQNQYLYDVRKNAKKENRNKRFRIKTKPF